MESDYSEIRKELEKAKVDNQLKTTLWANMSHEIRTPINAIVGFARLIAESNDEEEKKEFLEIIEENNALLTQIISDVLDLSQIETQTLNISNNNFNVKKLLEEVFHSAMIRNRNSMVQIEIDDLPNVDIFSDHVRVNQLLTNFINNAMKYTTEGSIHIGCNECDNGESLYFYVSDTGKGIPKDKQECIFDRYVILGNETNSFGLGLSICKNIIKMLGGTIGVVSEVDKGSTFWFKLPMIVDETKPKVNPVVRISPPKTDGNNLPLLLVAEDDASNYCLVEQLLKNDYRLLHAWDGVEVIEMYKQCQPDVILMDINMSNINGYQAFEKIRELDAKIPIIAVTAYAMSNEEHKILEAGFNGYLSKPINIKKFREEIKNYLK